MTPAGHDILLQIINALHRFNHLDRLLGYVTRMVRQQMAVDGAAVLFLDSSGSELTVQVGSFTDGAVERRLGTIRFPAEKGVAGEICRTGRPLIINDYARSPYAFRHVDEQAQYETRSMLGVPMLHKGAIIGVLCLVNKEEGPFRERDAELLSAVADVATLAVVQARTQDALAQAMARVDALDQAKEAAIVHLSHELKPR